MVQGLQRRKLVPVQVNNRFANDLGSDRVPDHLRPDRHAVGLANHLGTDDRDTDRLPRRVRSHDDPGGVTVGPRAPGRA